MASALVMAVATQYEGLKPGALSAVTPMSTVILVIHLMIAAALVGIIMLQRSEGGALGIGGGGGGGFMTGRGTANLLTRITAGLAAAFFCTSILLTILARQTSEPVSVLDEVAPPQQQQQQQPIEEGLPSLPPLSPN